MNLKEIVRRLEPVSQEEAWRSLLFLHSTGFFREMIQEASKSYLAEGRVHTSESATMLDSRVRFQERVALAESFIDALDKIAEET